MIKKYNFMIFRLFLLVISACGISVSSSFAQQRNSSLYTGDKEINMTVYKSYEQKTEALLASFHIDMKSVLSGIAKNAAEQKKFKAYLKSRMMHDRRELIIQVGEGKIITKADLQRFLDSKHNKYKLLYTTEFLTTEAATANNSPGRASTEDGGMPFDPGRSPGQPCNNMDFNTSSLTGWNGSWGSSQDPSGTVGFDMGAVNSTGNEHTIMTGGTDGAIPAIPCVMPGGGPASLRLGEFAGGGLESARISQTFMVNAASPYFTYNYAAVIQDGGSGHTAPIQPYFKIRMYLGVDNTGTPIDCASLDINGTSAASLGLTLSGTYYYKNWTQVLIPLNAYAGQNVTIEFTVSDCMGSVDASGNPAPGSHDAWAYIDCSCNPPQIVTSSPTICGGTSITVSAPAGLASYSWTGPGIVGAANGQTITANAAGTYTVTMQTVTTPPNLPCTFSLDTIIPGNPAVPIANFTSTVVCTGTSTAFTDQSTPVGSINTWSWDFDNNGTPDNTTQNPTHTYAAAGTYPVTLTVTWGGCTDNFTANVVVNPGVAPVINPAGPFCINAAPVTLTATVAGGTWSGNGITNASTGAFDPSAATVGNNTISYTTSGACGGTTTAVVVINPLPVSNAGADVTICSGTAASIGTATTAGYTYAWLPAAGLSATNISNPGITTVNSGTTPIVTTYTVTTTANTCTSTDAVLVTVNPQPVLVITNPPAVCSPNTVDITAAAVTAGSTGGGVLSYWTDAAATAALAAPAAVSASGTYYIKVTATGGCTDIDPVVVTINPLPVSNAGTDVTICSGTAASIGTASTAGYGYAWLPAAGLSATNVSNPNITTANGGTTPIVTTYTVTTSVTATGCTTTDNVLVTVNPQPVLAITNPAAVCSPNTVDITAAAVTAGSTGGGVLSYWTDAAATAALAAPTAVATSGTYYIKVTATGGCTDIDPVVVTINPLPVSNAGTDVTICSGIAASVGTASTAGYGYAWLPATGLSATNVSNPNITTVNGGTTPIVTTYTVTTTITATGCSTNDTVLVTVNPQPVLAITNPAAVCSPSTVDITAAAITAGSTGGGVLSYWTDAAATSALAAPTAVTASGTYYIKVTATGGCTDIDPVVVVVNPLPVSNAGPDVTICTGTAASVGAPAVAGNTYAWLPATGLSAANVSNPSNTTTNATASPIVTTYTVTTTITATGCQSADTVVVTVNPFPVISTTDPAAVCAPGTVDITAPAVTAGTIGSGVYSYWTDAAATVPLATPAAVASSGTYYIKLVSGTGCSDLDSVVVTINPLPVSDAGPDLAICTGSSGNIGAAAVAGYTYSWLPTTGLTPGANVASPSVSLTNPGVSPISTTYTVTTTNSVTGCQTKDSVVVTVNAVATANAGSTLPVCAGSSVPLSGAIGGSAVSGTWSGGAGTYAPNNTTLNAVYTPTSAEYAAGSVTLTLTTNDPAGPCSYASSSVTLNFFQNPVVNFSVDDPNGCPIHCASFTDLSTVVPGDAIVSWNWNFGDGTPDSTSQNTSHCYPLTGFYDVTLTVTSNHGCVSDSTQVHMVQVYAKPVADFTPTPNPASILNPEVTLNNGSSSDVISWNYYFGDGDSIAPNVSSPVHMYPTSGPETYIATLMVQNADGCRDTITHPLEIGPEFTFYIPNAFTPNGDGINDYFYGQGIGIKKYDIYIFDRWGNMIYHGDNIDTSQWDGRANHGSDIAQQDVYVWKVRLTDVFDKKHNYIGTVTLVK